MWKDPNPKPNPPRHLLETEQCVCGGGRVVLSREGPGFKPQHPWMLTGHVTQGKPLTRLSIRFPVRKMKLTFFPGLLP